MTTKKKTTKKKATRKKATSKKPDRASNGHYLPGQSGNPAGRPKGLIRWAREQAAEILRNEGVDGNAFMIMGNILHGEYNASPGDRISAFRELANRTLGKSLTYVEVTGMDEEPLMGPSIDPAALTDKQLVTLLSLMEKATVKK